MRKLMPWIAVVLTVVAAQFWLAERETGPTDVSQGARVETRIDGADAVLASAYRERRSNIQVMGEGTVTRVLADDNDGDRHQRFVLALATGQTLLVAHNVDLAPRIPDLRNGDRIRFNGEYEWNEQGGVIHWTHADPAGRHVTGWLERDGTRYD